MNPFYKWFYLSNHGGVSIEVLYKGTLDVDPGIGIVKVNAPGNTAFIAKYDNGGDYIN